MLEFILVCYILFACIALLLDEPKRPKYRFMDVDQMIALNRKQGTDSDIHIKILKNRFSGPQQFWFEADYDKAKWWETDIDLPCPFCAIEAAQGYDDFLKDEEVVDDYQELIDDGFGNFFPATCECGAPNEIVRPGKYQCSVGGHE